MIERVLIKNQLSFEACELEFSNGLNAFTGPSGAGKSILLQAILSLFGFYEANANLVEAVVDKKLGLDAFGLEEDEPNIFKFVKEKSTRYFINTQSVSKKSMSEIASSFIGYLSVRDESEFASEKLISLLDALVEKDKSGHSKEVREYQELYFAYLQEKNKLDELEAQEKKIEELKEFASYEIQKIEDISPKIGEDEELLSFKRSLSKKEKIEQVLTSASEIFNFESYVSEFLNLIEAQSGFFDEAMNELRALVEEQREKLNDLEDIDVEALLDRIEKISSLKNRHGSIEDVLAYKKTKEEELASYEQISFTKGALIKSCKEKNAKLTLQAEEISKRRIKSLELLNGVINSYLEQLYMPKVSVKQEQIELSEFGIDLLHVELGNVNVKKISSGEYNRLRLAFIATSSDLLKSGSGILFLDEIDANLSGKESMSVANVLKKISTRYQIFAISHQPQLSSQADLHFLVTKENEKSLVKKLEDEERIVELARMVSGESVSEEALSFARTLMNQEN